MEPIDEKFLRDERDQKRRESQHEVQPWLAENEPDLPRETSPGTIWEHEQPATD